MAKSVEEQVENWAKQQLHDIGVHAYAKTEPINSEIQEALAKWPSKSGGSGPNYPDLKVFIETAHGLKIPVMVEVKGTEGFLVKVNGDNEPQLKNVTAAGKSDYPTINKYALNGAIHYANGVIAGTKSYKSVIAIGLNGWKKPDGKLATEMAVYYVSQDYFLVPKEIGKYSDLSFLKKEHESELIEKIANLSLTAQEKEEKTRDIENSIERNLKDLNQKMHDELHISAQMRVFLISGMIIAGLGHHKDDGACVVAPLDSSELTGESGKLSNDGVKIFNKISSVLAEKRLPEEKRNVILEMLHAAFYNEQFYTAHHGESPLRVVYRFVQEKIMVYFNTKYHLDFTGRLFNVMNSWAHDPNDPNNDVVLTPRYVAEFMARMCRVNKDSYVWDYAAGSAGFLVSAMKLMVEDAEKSMSSSPVERDRKILSLKLNQLLGIEILQDVYMLAVLNMILMGDGSSNIINGDSLKYDGTYHQGAKKSTPFPADVFLLNPPYSAPGKGLVFVEKALSRMSHGRAAVLIMENAGSGMGNPYAQQILTKNTLLASIHMADIFCGKAGVQAAIYVFEVGVPHNVNQPVKFIDFSDDGYIRQDRKKSSLSTNLRDAGDAKARYDEVVNLVLFGASKRNLIPEDCYIEDTISLEGNDWTYVQHKKVDATAKIEDFQKVVTEYLSWKIGEIIKAEGSLGKSEARV